MSGQLVRRVAKFEGTGCCWRCQRDCCAGMRVSTGSVVAAGTTTLGSRDSRLSLCYIMRLCQLCCSLWSDTLTVRYFCNEDVDWQAQAGLELTFQLRQPRTGPVRLFGKPPGLMAEHVPLPASSTSGRSGSLIAHRPVA